MFAPATRLLYYGVFDTCTWIFLPVIFPYFSSSSFLVPVFCSSLSVCLCICLSGIRFCVVGLGGLVYILTAATSMELGGRAGCSRMVVVQHKSKRNVSLSDTRELGMRGEVKQMRHGAVGPLGEPWAGISRLKRWRGRGLRARAMQVM